MTLREGHGQHFPCSCLLALGSTVRSPVHKFMHKRWVLMGYMGCPNQADVASLEAALMAARAEYEKVTERNLQVYISTTWGSGRELCTHIQS